MTRPVLQIAADVAHIVGIRAPSTLQGVSERSDQALLALLNQSGPQLAGMSGPFFESWPGLVKRATITTVAGLAEYPLPQDFVSLIEDTMWDASTTWPAAGPLTPREWQSVTLGLTGSGTLTPLYRLSAALDAQGRQVIALHPTPAELRHLPYEYRSSAWLRADPTTPPARALVQQDSDIPVFPAHLMVLDLVWRWRKARGLPFAADLADYELERDRQFAEVVGYQRIRLNSPRSRIPTLRIPETGYGPSA